MATLVFSCSQCGKRMKSIPPAPVFSVTCVGCLHQFTVHAAALQQAAPPAPPPADDSGEAEITDGDTTGADVFADYHTSFEIPGALPHPADVVESQSLASTPAPSVVYKSVYELEHWPLHPVLRAGKLSELQLETVSLCGARHTRLLPDGRRAGFFLGDGAGVGKGRQIAGVILDNTVRGRRKHLWFSTSTDLRLDAERDLSDLGAPGISVHDGCQQ
ncbi:P-loop containing NTP hydrolase pore-1-domain-containing protein [Pavlovales sp. CCMP2436]|nr:P-loop containing NTP hydrolase pore-1-domain-containing protein [Pavlovales sp. CCMP2436]